MIRRLIIAEDRDDWHKRPREYHMYPIAVNDVVELTYFAKLYGQTVMNTFFYRSLVADADGQAQLNIIGAAFADQIVTPIQNAQSQDVEQCKIRVQLIHPTRYQPLVINAANPTGANAVVASDAGHAVIVRRKADAAGRKYQGRIYIAGVDRVFLEAGQVTAAFMSSFKAPLESMMLNDLLDPGDIPLAEHIIFQLSAPVTTNKVTYAQVDPVIRYQRRREVGVGI